MNDIKDINKVIRKSGLKSTTLFLNSFLDKEDEILNILKKSIGSTSEIYLKEIDNNLTNTLTFSSLFSDMTILNITPSNLNSSNFTFYEPGSKYFRDRQITIPNEYLKETGNDPQRFFPCYIHRNDSETKKIFQNYAPLIKSDRVLVRPLRAIYISFPELEQGKVFYVDPNTLNDHWFVNKVQQSDSIIIDNGFMSFSDITDLFEITLPYFQNINLNTFNKILNDENELLSSFRTKLKKIIVEASNDPKRIEEIKNDIASSSTPVRRFKLTPCRRSKLTPCLMR